ncbi:MAG: M56 family metallopeptidase [Siphonobacter sp.]
MAIYLLQVSMSFMGFAALYALLLRRETYYQANRFYFWAAGFISLLIPVFSEWLSTPPVIQTAQAYVPDLTFQYQEEVSDSQISFTQFLLVVWLVGLGVMIIRFLFQLIKLMQLWGRSEASWVNEQRIYIPPQGTSAFSFFNLIFLNAQHYTALELDEVLRHEQAHVRQKHSYDVLMTEFLQILLWFNPVIWWWSRIVRQNLEFMADQAVLEQGMEARHYQYHLLRQSGLALPVSNHFNMSELKNRIQQINTPDSARWKRIKLLLVIPVMSFWIVAFAPRQVVEQVQESWHKNVEGQPVLPKKGMTVSIQSKHRRTALEDTVRPVEPVTSKATLKAEPIYFLNGERVNGLELHQVDPNFIDRINVYKTGPEVEPLGEEARNGVVKIYTKEIPATQIKSLHLKATSPTNFTTGGEPLYLIGDTEVSINDISVKDIKKVEVIKAFTALEKYGERGKNEVIIITLK